MIDFNNTLIRCSAIGKIMTYPKGYITEKQLQLLEQLQAKPNRTDKQTQTMEELIEKKKESEKEPLSADAKKYLIEVYVYAKYGRQVKGLDDVKQIAKGRMVEEETITLLSKLDRKFYQKNDLRLDNEYLTGEPDVYEGENIYRAKYLIDAKSSWDLYSFLSVVGCKLDPSYYGQMQGYFALTGCVEGEVSHCLVNTPEMLVNDEKYRLFRAMGVATEENQEYLTACAMLEMNMRFDDIPEVERRIKFPVVRDEQYIEKVYKRVESCRKWLVDFEKMHLTPSEITSMVGVLEGEINE